MNNFLLLYTSLCHHQIDGSTVHTLVYSILQLCYLVPNDTLRADVDDGTVDDVDF